MRASPEIVGKKFSNHTFPAKNEKGKDAAGSCTTENCCKNFRSF
jgi:hypothetical protein